MKELTEQQTQDIKDLSCRITEDLVNIGFIKNCTDTESTQEWDTNDLIYNHIERFLKELNN